MSVVSVITVPADIFDLPARPAERPPMPPDGIGDPLVPGVADVVADWRNRATLSVAEGAKVLGIGEDAVRCAIKRGQIPAIQFSRKIRIPVPALLCLLEGGAP
jgi:excisionase family DNA binding protein